MGATIRHEAALMPVLRSCGAETSNPRWAPRPRGTFAGYCHEVIVARISSAARAIALDAPRRRRLHVIGPPPNEFGIFGPIASEPAALLGTP
jgi:hypothetical protein